MLGVATFIQTTLDDLDLAITGYASSSFAQFAAPIATVCQAMGIVGLAFIAINALLQWVPIRVGEYMKWALRYVAVTAVATSWAQFQPIYEIVTNTPGAIGAELIGAVGAPNLNVAFDAMIDQLFEFSDKLADEAGLFRISLASIVVWIIGGLMAAAAIIVIALGKIGLAMAIALAPFFIPALMFRGTSNLFESWVRFTLGFALIPLVMAGVIGAIVGIGQGLIVDAEGATELADAAGFIIVGVGAVFLTLQVPSLVNGLSGTITATANGVAMAMGGAGMGVGAAATTAATGNAARRAVMPAVRGEMEARAAGRDAKASGGDPVAARSAERQRQKAHRLKYAHKATAFAATHGKQLSRSERFAAANAGQVFETRKARQERRARSATPTPTQASAQSNPGQPKTD